MSTIKNKRKDFFLRTWLLETQVQKYDYKLEHENLNEIVNIYIKSYNAITQLFHEHAQKYGLTRSIRCIWYKI